MGGFEHIFGKDAVAFGWVIDKHVSNGANQLSVLYYRASAHECVNIGPTNHKHFLSRIRVNLFRTVGEQFNISCTFSSSTPI